MVPIKGISFSNVSNFKGLAFDLQFETTVIYIVVDGKDLKRGLGRLGRRRLGRYGRRRIGRLDRGRKGRFRDRSSGREFYEQSRYRK
jgi:hypothetical protein